MQFEWDPEKRKSLKKANTGSDEMRAEYRREDFGPMVRGKYAARMRESSNVVVLEPDVAKAFPNAQAVNDALRGLIELAKTSTRPRPQSTQTQGPGAHGE